MYVTSWLCFFASNILLRQENSAGISSCLSEALPRYLYILEVQQELFYLHQSIKETHDLSWKRGKCQWLRHKNTHLFLSSPWQIGITSKRNTICVGVNNRSYVTGFAWADRTRSLPKQTPWQFFAWQVPNKSGTPQIIKTVSPSGLELFGDLCCSRLIGVRFSERAVHPAVYFSWGLYFCCAGGTAPALIPCTNIPCTNFHTNECISFVTLASEFLTAFVIQSESS